MRSLHLPVPTPPCHAPLGWLSYSKGWLAGSSFVLSCSSVCSSALCGHLGGHQDGHDAVRLLTGCCAGAARWSRLESREMRLPE